MKIVFTGCFVIIFSFFSKDQSDSHHSFVSGDSKNKIRIALVGTVHFTPSAVDAYKNAALDVMGERRQSEIQQVISKFISFRPDQICIEYPISGQKQMDSV